MASPRTRLWEQQQQQWETREGAFEICNVAADNIGRHFLEEQQQELLRVLLIS